MEIKCEYCGSIIKETDEKCPYCGATNNAVKRTADGTPKTIEQLQQWYVDRHLPPYEVTRFFIGINYTKPRAFGIYKEGNEFIVYKNKANGERAVRYRGTDEAYAVNELYLKLKDEILNQKAHNQDRRSQYKNTSNTEKASVGKVLKYMLIIILAIVAFIGVVIVGLILDELYKGLPVTIIVSLIAAVFVTIFSLCFITDHKERSKFCEKYSSWISKENNEGYHWLGHYAICVLLCGLILIQPIHNYCKIDYYSYNDRIYVNSHYHWFEYDGYDYDRVSRSDIPDEVLDNKTAYGFDYADDEWNNSFTAFEDSNYYEEHYNSSSDSDSDYDWDSNDSWDSNDTDWDSDW